MKHVCVVTEEKSVNVLKIRTRSSASELPVTLGLCYNKIITYLQNESLQMNGAPFVVYYNMDMENLDIEIGIPIASEAKGNEEIISSIIPSGKYVSTIHVGPYDTLESAYKDLGQFLEDKKLQPSGIAYEFYLNDPSEVTLEEIQTKIMFSLI